MDCIHNARCRYTHGFYCEDCSTFFPKESATYRSDELLSSIRMVLNNINVDLVRANKSKDEEIENLMDIIGIGKKHANYEELITQSQVLMKKYSKNEKSATMMLKGK